MALTFMEDKMWHIAQKTPQSNQLRTPIIMQFAAMGRKAVQANFSLLRIEAEVIREAKEEAFCLKTTLIRLLVRERHGNK